MDAKQASLNSICENLMNVVVESRKRFGNTCGDYDHKLLLIENRLLNLQVQTAANYHFRPKTPIPEIIDDPSYELDDFLGEVSEKQKRIDDLKKKLKDTQDVISQLESDSVGKKLRAPLDANAMLAKAKAKDI